ncbi:tRNA lysidine(34) synthetase TilS [Domibacillus tundrae]|uniref:tRNA lysidine(34) synthetase TilS n=1 Tax=Domibacillus tundrae TaxID=1587527 RepID=UPI0009E47E0C|nr:tRNA lysidine(34) synthetase TilS [Domibacillus tundrae]
MHFFEENVKQFMEKKRMVEWGDHVAVAVSGGIDSMALLSLLHKQRTRLGISVSAIHVDHMLRGCESYEDLRFVESFCRERDISFFGRRADAQHEADVSRIGIQKAARHVRYALFEQGMDELGANKLAMAHHADDQVETVLMQLTRGGHTQTGMPAIRSFAGGQLIRPFLAVTKEDIGAYTIENSIAYREDPSNKKDTYTRNRFRHQVLAFLKKENPKASFHIQHFAEGRQEDECLLRAMAEEQIKNMTIWKQESVSLQIKPFQEVPLPLQKRAIHLILNYLYHGKTAFSFLHIQHILQLLQTTAPSGRLNLPSCLSVRKINEQCVFAYETDDEPDCDPNLLFVEDRLYRRGVGTFTLTNNSGCPDGADCFRLNPDTPIPICIRMRQDGDRIQLKGMNGSKKLARLLIDEKVPLAYRGHIPVVTDANGTILWIPGIRKSIHEGDGPLLLIYEKE